MPFSTVQSKTIFAPQFSATDKAALLAAMQTAYNGSTIAQTMFDNFVNAGKTATIKFFCYFLFLLVFFSPLPSFACVKEKPFNTQEEQQATIVFHGKIESYIYASSGYLKDSGDTLNKGVGQNTAAAKLKFRIIEVYRGKVKADTIDVYLRHSTIHGIPKDINEYIKRYEAESIIGIAPVDNAKSINSLSRTSINSIKLMKEYNLPFIQDDNFEKSYWIIQHPCSVPYIRKLNSNNF